MKVLIISEVLTHPTQMGNQQGILRECVQMKKMGWEVDFLYFGNEISAAVDLAAAYFGKNHFFQCFKGQYSNKTQIKRVIREYMDRKGISKYIALKYNADEWYTNEIEAVICDLYKNNGYDAVWMQYFFQSKVYETIKDIPVLKVIDTHDKWANRNRIYQKLGKVPVLFYTTKQQERKALSRADVVNAVQEKEEKYFKKLLKGTDTKVFTIGDLVEKKISGDGQAYTYGLIGAGNAPNVVGVEWFRDHVLPIVCRLCPESKFILAGGICDKIEDHPNIHKQGRVDQLEEFYNMVQVTLNPIQNGTGLSIKTIEALGYGKPLVATSVGAQAIFSEKEVLISCDEPQEFAENIVRLLKEADVRQKMSREAHIFIDQYNEKYLNVLREIEKLAELKRGTEWKIQS